MLIAYGLQDDFEAARDVVLKLQPAHIESLPDMVSDLRNLAGTRRGRRKISAAPSDGQKKIGKTLARNYEIVEADMSEADRISEPRGRKRKSILQPKGGKFAQKAAYRKQTLRSNTRIWLQSIDDIEDSSSSGEDEEVYTAPDEMSLARIMPSPTRPQDKVQQRVQDKAIGAPLPSYYEPRGYGETWICPYDGCYHKVPNARDITSVNAIKDHFVADHAGAAQELINQESRPWVSVSHLLERVTGIASLQRADQQLGFRSRIVKKS